MIEREQNFRKNPCPCQRFARPGRRTTKLFLSSGGTKHESGRRSKIQAPIAINGIGTSAGSREDANPKSEFQPYLRLYVPINSPWARICLAIACSRLCFVPIRV